MEPHVIAMLDEIDAECRKHGLPPISWIVHDVPGRPNATDEQVAQVFEAAISGKYHLIYTIRTRH